jgi:hypothetical protein
MQHPTKLWYGLRGLLPVLLCALALGASLVTPRTASAVDNGPTVTGEVGPNAASPTRAVPG